MKRFVVLLLILYGCGACFSIDTPAPTEAGWKLFGYADEAFGAHRRAVMRAVHLDEYRRQTTDEGRLEVHERYFPRERIVDKGEVWHVVSTEYVWTFEIVGGRSLAEPDAEWRIAYKVDTSNLATKVTIRSGDDGALSAESEIDRLRFTTSADTKAHVTRLTDGRLSLSFFSGEGALRGLDVPRLDVSYTICEPVVLTDADNIPQPGGAIAIHAYNQVDAVDEEVAARYLTKGKVEIVYLGQTWVWSTEDSDERNPLNGGSPY